MAERIEATQEDDAVKKLTELFHDVVRLSRAVGNENAGRQLRDILNDFEAKSEIMEPGGWNYIFELPRKQAKTDLAELFGKVAKASDGVTDASVRGELKATVAAGQEKLKVLG